MSDSVVANYKRDSPFIFYSKLIKSMQVQQIYKNLKTGIHRKTS